MADTKSSSFPHVLAEYNPDFVPKIARFKQAKTKQQHHCDQEKSSSNVNKGKSRLCSSKMSNHDSDTRIKSAKSTSRKSRKSDEQRYEELSDKWDKAKEEARLEDHEALLEKISLQQELIRKQDEYAQQKRQEVAQAEAEKRESERAKKQAKENQLQLICKQSLEEDKKLHLEEKRPAKLKSRNALSTLTTSSSSSSPTKSPTTPTKSPTTPGGHHSNPFRMTLPAFAPTPDTLDSENEDEDDELKGSTPSQALPWHEQQLYKLYGKKADYFLHPKIENKAKEKKTNPKLRKQGVEQLLNNNREDHEDGRVGAEVLWQTLRQDSNKRLLKEDEVIPGELKDAYSSFARQSLKKNRIPTRRMFCTQDDLPEMPRLLDNQKVQRVRKLRHKSDLMYRASVSNQDRTEVLTFNNPLPEFHEGSEGIDQYLPSWQEDIHTDSTLQDCKRWLQEKGGTVHENTIHEVDEKGDHEVPKKPQVIQSLDDDMIFVLSRRQKPQTKQKYLFLSEKDTTVKGMFSEKYKGERENKDIPQPYMGNIQKSYSVLDGMISATPDATKSNSSLRYSAPLPVRGMQENTFTSNWQPLSMHALIEYKKQKSTVGEGDFNLGRTKMWSHIPVA